LRRILVIGEAATRLAPETMAEFGAILFRKMAAMRNRVVHDYGQIDFEIVWEAATVHVTQVRTELAHYFSTAGEAQIEDTAE
jgi:uncharacterized protein with HEPN domain